MLISIITINYNNKLGLERTLKSVRNQTYTGFEHIVIDGNSNDGSKDLLNSYKDKFSYCVSETDEGIYNAMNKGIKEAKGDYLFFLNSGDDLLDAKSLEKVAKHLTGEDLIYFNINVVEKDVVTEKVIPTNLSFFYLHNDTIPHQSLFLKRNLFNKIGLYDENFTIISDWKFILEALLKHNVSYKHINDVISNFYMGGVSSSEGGFLAMEKERKMVLDKEFPVLVNDLKEIHKLNRKLRTLKKSRTLQWLIKLGLINKF